jgi:hypothetical protein
MSLRLLYLITPVSGYLKNYIKYKRVNVGTFSRTPLVYIMIDRILSYYKLKNVVLWTIVLERWFFFYFKMIRAYLLDHYHQRKQKYKVKYELKYDSSQDDLQDIQENPNERDST